MLKYIFKIAIIAFGLIVVSFNAYAYEKGDFQIWNTDVEEVKIHKNVKFVMEQEFRFAENAGEFYHQHYDWGFLYSFAKILDLGFFYRLVLEKYKQKWREEDKLYVNAALKFDLGKFKLEDRNRLEFCHFKYKEDFIRYRNRVSLKYPIEFKSMTVAPYTSDEIFVTSNGTGYSENRFSAGMEFILTEYAKADIYYMLKSNRIVADKWTCANVLGTKIKISF